MKTIKVLLGVAFLSIAVWSCKNETAPETKTVEVETTEVKKQIDPNAVIAKAEFNIEGMTCEIGCAKTIEKKLAKMDGVKSAKVDFDKKLAMVEYDEANVTTTNLEETVTGVGESYSVNNMKTVESFTSNDAKKGCDKDCKKACCKDKDSKASCKGKKECKTKCSEDCTDKDCTKCAEKKAECKKKCDAKKANESKDKA